MEPITTPEELERFGFIVTEEAIMRASTRLRGWTGSPITRSTVTQTFWETDNVRHLGSRPVRSITSVVEEGKDVPLHFRRDGEARIWTALCPVTVTYEAGWDVVPDEVLEIVGAVADRIELAARSAPARGVSMEVSGSTTISYSGALVSRAEELTDSEKRTLARFFPRAVRFVQTGVNYSDGRENWWYAV